ncbi:hypothetical protein SRHO_G00095700 [Serrasalmus rhombeus]
MLSRLKRFDGKDKVIGHCLSLTNKQVFSMRSKGSHIKHTLLYLPVNDTEIRAEQL